MILIPIFTAIGLGLFFLIADGMCSKDLKKSNKRLETYKHKEAEFSSGKVTYVDRGKGDDVLLSIHGLFGGYDQGFDTARPLVSSYRVIAPSRFGYLGSDMPADKAPKEQAKVFAELLDSLEVEQVYLLAASSGGPVAIRFALDYPERVKGLVLYSSFAPFTEKPKRYKKYIGPPAFNCSNYTMYLASLFFKPAMSMEREAIYAMLPIADRRDGIINDASVVNPDMAKNFDEYPIEEITVPVLVFQAKNDKIAKYKPMEKGVRRFPDHTFITFDKGGHMLDECGKQIMEELKGFLKKIADKDAEQESAKKAGKKADKKASKEAKKKAEKKAKKEPKKESKSDEV